MGDTHLDGHFSPAPTGTYEPNAFDLLDSGAVTDSALSSHEDRQLRDTARDQIANRALRAVQLLRRL